MPYQNSEGNSNEITAREAQQIIELYAERERRRLQEAERIADMPKLADVAALVGMPVNELKLMLSEVYIDYDIPVTVDPSGEEHIPKDDAAALIEYVGSVEEQRQRELGRKASLTTLEDVALNLGVSNDEASEMLLQVRSMNRTAPMPEPEPLAYSPHEAIKPKDAEQSNSQAIEGNDFEIRRSKSEESGAVMMISLFVILAIVVVAAVVAEMHPGAYRPPPEVIPQAIVSPSPAMTSGTVTAKVANPFNPKITELDVRGPAVPAGWSVTVNDTCKTIMQDSNSASSAWGPQEQLHLRRSIQSMVQAASAPTLVTGPLVVAPLSPSSSVPHSSDLEQWAIVTVRNASTVRQAYVRKLNQGETVSAKADFNLRLDYLVGKTSAAAMAKSFPQIQPIAEAETGLPNGFRIAVMAKNRCYQAMGKSGPAATLSRQELINRIEDSVAALVQQVSRLEPKLTGDHSLEIHYTFGTKSLDFGNYLRAVRSKRASDMSIAGLELNSAVQSAVDNYRSAK